MTENCATCSRSWNGDPTATGTVGPPQPGLDLKLVDVPAMGYHADDKPNPRGEICLKGEMCFKGYYKGEKLLSLILRQFTSRIQILRTLRGPSMKRVGCTPEILD